MPAYIFAFVIGAPLMLESVIEEQDAFTTSPPSEPIDSYAEVKASSIWVANYANKALFI